jgi:acetoin utilization deacetylase AcuC-like enzyme
LSVAIISHHECIEHGAGIAHPENGLRLSSIHDAFIENHLAHLLHFYEAPKASRDQLCYVHSREHVDSIFKAAPDKGVIWLDPDTFMTPDSLNAALRAAGANILAVDLLMQNKARQVFCSVRPPGHHAEHDRAMGFCLFNNIAIGAVYAKQKYGVRRIAIIDFDVHHGNGTEDIFKDESDILFCSLFQHPYYPYKGANTRSDHIINIPISAGTESSEYRDLFTKYCIPAIMNFEPELILVSAGFDAHIEDELAGICLTDSDYAWLACEIKNLAQKNCEGKVAFTLEGGYSFPALSQSVVAVIKELIN